MILDATSGFLSLPRWKLLGFTVKKETLLEMQAENELVIEKLTQEIYELAGEEFNINSPKQLGVSSL